MWKLAVVLLALLAVGCGSERDRNKNKNLDRPISDTLEKK